MRNLEEETIKTKGVKYVILGDIPDMGRAGFVRMRKGVREVEEAAERILEAETLFLFPAFSG